jgi:molybdopterin synthase catalytic subunit
MQLDEFLSILEDHSTGAVVFFDGRVRNHSQGKDVLYLEYEANESMAIKEMENICCRARDRWPIEKVAVFHRVGRVNLGESSVFVGVSCAHRGPAFSACEFIIDELKKNVPIWKKEFYTDGEQWIGSGG